MLPGTFAGTMGVNLNGKYATDSLGTLLISDGADTGTHSLKAFYRISAMLVVGSKLYMIACDTPEHGSELWASDGTAGGTYLVKEINPALNASGVMYFGFSDYSLTAYNDHVYFYGNDGIHGTELWKSDGTDTGTLMVRDINPMPGADIILLSSFVFGVMKAAGGKLYFSADDGINGSELWSTDGTSANTHMVKDLTPGTSGSNPLYLTAIGGKMSFWASDGVDSGIFVTDGTDTGTHLLAGHIFAPNSESVISGGKLYFFADSISSIARSLFVTDGTAAGTSWVSPAFYGLTQYSYMSYLSSFLSAYGGKLYFGAADNLWQSTGTVGSTHLFKDLTSLSGLCCTPTQITAFGGKMYMKAKGFNGRIEIVVSDGTDTGTHILPFAGEDFSTSSDFVINNNLTYPLTVVGSKLFFWNTYTNASGHALYAIDLAPTATTYSNHPPDFIRLYPNPFSNILNITVPSGQRISKVDILGIDGRLIKSVAVNGSNNTSVSIEDCSNTLIIVKAYTDEGIITSKVQCRN